MTEKLIAGWKLVLRNLGNAVRRRTIVDHLCFGPDAGVLRVDVVSTAAVGTVSVRCSPPPTQLALPVSANLHVIAGPEFIFCFSVSTLGNRLHHQLMN